MKIVFILGLLLYPLSALAAQEPVAFIDSAESNEVLDPKDGSLFIVSLNFKLEGSVSVADKSVSLVSKVTIDKDTARGWEVVLRREKTSLRAGVFWQGEGGGGSYIFDEVKIIKDKYYTLSLIAKTGEYLALYLEEVGSSNVIFLGGYDISKRITPKTLAPLTIKRPREKRRNFNGEVIEVLIANVTSQMPKDIAQCKKLLQGGAEGIVRQIKEDEISLWYSPREVDASRFKRKIVGL